MERVNTPFCDIWNDGERPTLARQFLCGEAVEIEEAHPAREGVVAVSRQKDGYRGYAFRSDFAQSPAPNYKVKTRAALAFQAADIKSAVPTLLPMGAAFHGTWEKDFLKTHLGYIHKAHICPLATLRDDPVTVACEFLGTPYLWGGNTDQGLDCSGLVTTAFEACGIALPADTSAQNRSGEAVKDLRRNDLIFWEGHVAIATDEDRLIHANAHHMKVAYETLQDAVMRIRDAGGGLPIAQRRVWPKR